MEVAEEGKTEGVEEGETVVVEVVEEGVEEGIEEGVEEGEREGANLNTGSSLFGGVCTDWRGSVTDMMVRSLSTWLSDEE